MAKQIFIGGTGRSGTTILYELLNSHKSIYSFDMEMRFIIDFHGLQSLTDALTQNYSVPVSREALYCFERMMKKDLTNKYKAPYVWFEFEKLFGKEFYSDKLEFFLSSLTDGSFYGTDLPVRGGFINDNFYLLVRIIEKINNVFFPSKKNKVLWPHREMRNVRFFKDREKLIHLMAEFVDSLFMKVVHEHNASIWCEKTPSNVLHMDYIYELFPDCHFIHIKRDPRGVVQSMQNQFWSDPDLKASCYLMKQVYQKFFQLRDREVSSGRQYLEIKLEDLAGDYDKTVSEIINFLNIDNEFISPPNVSIDKVSYWKKRLSEKEKDIINNILEDEIKMMGYTL